VAGLARRSFLSLTAAFVVAGFVLGQGGLELLDLRAREGFVEALVIVALILILLRDGLEVGEEMLQEAWHLPFRKLLLAMPLTAGLVALAAHELAGPAGRSPSSSVRCSLRPIRCCRPRSSPTRGFRA
jgi:NhaP-type Na+/H+ or K+/H+ antiporter